jgi:hypothetical protein
MPLLTDKSPYPVAEAREEKADTLKVVAGRNFVLVFSNAFEVPAMSYFDVRTVNFSLADFYAPTAAQGAVPISIVSFVDETVEDVDPFAITYPLVARGRATVIAHRGALPVFEWDF